MGKKRERGPWLAKKIWSSVVAGFSGSILPSPTPVLSLS